MAELFKTEENERMHPLIVFSRDVSSSPAAPLGQGADAMERLECLRKKEG